jgi:hypothetical protein
MQCFCSIVLAGNQVLGEPSDHHADLLQRSAGRFLFLLFAEINKSS